MLKLGFFSLKVIPTLVLTFEFIQLHIEKNKTRGRSRVVSGILIPSGGFCGLCCVIRPK